MLSSVSGLNAEGVEIEESERGVRVLGLSGADQAPEGSGGEVEDVLVVCGGDGAAGEDDETAASEERLVEQWDDCPAVIDDFDIAYSFITKRVAQLFDRLNAKEKKSLAR